MTWPIVAYRLGIVIIATAYFHFAYRNGFDPIKDGAALMGLIGALWGEGRVQNATS